MRLHHLEVTAFGPFADTATVDFDALSDAGLFLLTGATGAGKTSVLDAVCFALYGEVPGDRQSAKRLRADQAAPGVAPRVTLELSLAGRRFRLVRSPAWERPKKRGTGTTVEQASVRLLEDGQTGWTLLSSRLDETGHLVTHLVGMNLTQFCQVAMLPQGRFQAFLRARSDERHRLLQQLFRTGRFEQVERWLRDHRLGLRRDSRAHHEVVADLVSRISEAAGESLPDGWDVHDLLGPASDGTLAPWADGLLDAARADAQRSDLRAESATAAERASRTALETARADLEHRRTRAAAVAEHARLVAAADDHAARVDRLGAARRAAGVVPLHELALRAQREATRTGARADRLTGEVGALVGALIVDDLEAVLTAARDGVAAARALAPREQALGELRETLTGLEAEVEALTTRATALATEAEALPEAQREARADHQAAVEAASALTAVELELEGLLLRQRAADDVVRLTAELEEARVLRSAAVDACQLATETWLQLREERLHGMAAEIAGALAVGADCPVCGSVDHPHPASPRPGAPDAAAERAARRTVDDAEITRHAHDDRVRDLQTQLALAQHQAGESPATLGEAVAGARAEQARLSALAARLDRHAARVASLEADEARLRSERSSVDLALVAARAAITHRRAEAETLVSHLTMALRGSGCTSVAELAAHHATVVDAAQRAVDARADHRRAQQAADETDRELERAAAAAGFDAALDAIGAALDPDSLTDLEREIRAHETALARVGAVLADPDLAAAAERPEADVDQLHHRHADDEAALAAARTAAAVAATRVARVSGLTAELSAALAAWAPVREQLDLATRLAALADGSSPDNRLQMRLSGYVLAWRLAQVVAAANERLGRMSDQRYSLEHTGRRGAGESRGGLSLLVRDDWSGETRDPATLSGGETFVVSLALALGLADVIAHEVGGTDLDTLFVDEGFGSLDADTLDDVMDTLDSLRDGGRVVGVVSHVAEMRDRIPTQLQVTKSRRGSTVALAR